MASKHILVVDDEPRVAFFLGKTLERAPQNYRISTAKSGEEALEVLQQSHVDLLVTDLRMPGISGLDLLRWVRASNPDTRTILITAYGNDEVEREARHMQAYHYITKPFNISQFTDAVEDALYDVTGSEPGFVVLSGEAFEKIAEELETLRYNTGSMCVLLADMQGQRLVEVGNTESLDVTTLLALLGGGFVTNTELARQFGEGEAANLNFHQGTRYEIYSATVGDNLFVTLVYDRQSQPSRIGVVWLYARRTIDSLLEIVESNTNAQPDEVLGADFGASLAAEMDTIFANDEDFAPPQANVGFAPQADVGFAPQQNLGSAPQADVGFAPQQDVGSAPQTDGGFAPQADVGFAPQTDEGFAPQPDVGFAPQQDVGFAPQADVGFAPQQDVGSAPQQEESETNSRQDDDVPHRESTVASSQPTPGSNAGERRSAPQQQSAPPGRPRRRGRWDAQNLPDISAHQDDAAQSTTPLLSLEQAMDEGLVNPELRRLLGMDENHDGPEGS